MEVTWMMILKYVGWMLTVGTAFVGSWFFEYTVTDKETGRKKLTVWGHRGVVVAGVALICSLALTLWTDYDAAKKQKSAMAETTHYQRNLETTLADLRSLLVAISAIPPGHDKSTITQTVGRLEGIEDYRKRYPDLYARLLDSASLQEIKPIINERLDRDAAARISTRSECVDIPRSGEQGGFPGGQFKINETASLTYMITSDEVVFAFSDDRNLNSLGGGGYKFVFEDNAQSIELPCKEFKFGSACRDKTSDSSARDVYIKLQQKLVKAIKTNGKTYEVTTSVSEDMLRVFSCISP